MISVAALGVAAFALLRLNDTDLSLKIVLSLTATAGLALYLVLFALLAPRLRRKLSKQKPKKSTSVFLPGSFITLFVLSIAGLFLVYTPGLHPAIITIYFLSLAITFLLAALRLWYLILYRKIYRYLEDSDSGFVLHPYPLWYVRIRRFIAIAVLAVVLFTVYANWRVSMVAAPFLYSGMNDLPVNKVAVVPGTSSKMSSGNSNLYFRYRIEAVHELFLAGKVQYVILSGDNGTRTYNEPAQMRKALTALGVPDSVIYSDYAGFRTFDSVIRAWKVFGQNKYTFVSQGFQNERAVFIARHYGIEVVAFNARDVAGYSGFMNRSREVLARVNVMLDIVFNKQPKFLGEPVEIGRTQVNPESVEANAKIR